MVAPANQASDRPSQPPNRPPTTLNPPPPVRTTVGPPVQIIPSTSRPIAVITSSSQPPERAPTPSPATDIPREPATDKLNPPAKQEIQVPGPSASPSWTGEITTKTTTGSTDAFGGALENDVSSDTRKNAGSDQSVARLAESQAETTSVADQAVQSLASATEKGGFNGSIVVPGDRLAPAAETNLEAAESQNSSPQGHTKVIAGAVGGVAAIVVVVAFLIFCVRYRRKRRELGRLRDQVGRMPAREPPEEKEDWARFSTSSPLNSVVLRPMSEMTVDNTPSDNENVQNTGVSQALDALSMGTPTNSSDSTHRMYSHFQAVMPPPSMRSKRYSRTTDHTLKSDDAPTMNTGVETCHTLDSQTQLAYPIERPPSSAFSMDTTRPPPPVAAEATATAWATSYLRPRDPEPPNKNDLDLDMDIDEPVLSRKSSIRSMPTVSRTSTVTNLSLGAVGSENIGQAL